MRSARRVGTILLMLVLIISASSVQLFRDGGLSALLRNDLDAATLPPDRPTPGREEAGRLLGEVTDRPATASKDFQFTLKFPGQELPVMWGPCRPIHYVVRPDNAPASSARLLAQSLKQLSAATGLVFVNDGATDEQPTLVRKKLQPDRYGDRWAPVLIAWTSEKEVPRLKKQALSTTSPELFQPAGGKLGFVSGFLYLNAANVAERMRTEGDAFLHSLLLHELAHVVGLEHVQNRDQVMTRHDRRQVLTAYQDGDLTGLNVLGSGPCQPKV